MKDIIDSDSDMNDFNNPEMSQVSMNSQMMGNPMMSNPMMSDQASMQSMQSMQNMQHPQLQNPYVHNFDLSNMQTSNANPSTNQANPNISLNGTALQPITNNDVVGNIVNNPNPNIFQMNQPNTANTLPPKQEQLDPLMVNSMVPVITPQQMLSNLKQLNAI